jgi:hypothetical protein
VSPTSPELNHRVGRCAKAPREHAERALKSRGFRCDRVLDMNSEECQLAIDPSGCNPTMRPFRKVTHPDRSMEIPVTRLAEKR